MPSKEPSSLMTSYNQSYASSNDGLPDSGAVREDESDNSYNMGRHSSPLSQDQEQSPRPVVFYEVVALLAQLERLSVNAANDTCRTKSSHLDIGASAMETEQFQKHESETTGDWRLQAAIMARQFYSAVVDETLSNMGHLKHW
ncbi:DUF1212 domain membrane protein [Aspergillus tubingensis]|uniref:DUF1212 domain membrane protein n=1 Tax=Aspergillus tubingensis TaxID=5068 RepID=UPI0015785B53|nr:DUF1212 domain membrane protein [Aspergillus tubingensis]GFN20870.1 DUF1212 domain membrane protein [Aspergillus tubingensis]